MLLIVLLTRKRTPLPAYVAKNRLNIYQTGHIRSAKRAPIRPLDKRFFPAKKRKHLTRWTCHHAFLGRFAATTQGITSPTHSISLSEESKTTEPAALHGPVKRIHTLRGLLQKHINAKGRRARMKGDGRTGCKA